jgi:hypothetical protein
MHAVELRLLARSVIASKTLRSSPRNYVEYAIPAHFPNALTARHLDEIQIARGVEIDAEGRDEFRLCGWRSIFPRASAGHQLQAICPGDQRQANQTGKNKAMGVHEWGHFSGIHSCKQSSPFHVLVPIGLKESSEIPQTGLGCHQ